MPRPPRAADIVAMTVPYANHAATLDTIRPHLGGKILIDVDGFRLCHRKCEPYSSPRAVSVARAAQETLGEGVKVVSAFQNVAAAHLADLDHGVDCDVLVCGNDPQARARVIELAEDAGMTAWHAGRIANSTVAEALTSALIFINGQYKIPGAGIRITGTPRGD